MALVWVLLGILVLGGVAMVAAGRGQGLTAAEPDRPDLALPADGPLARSDVDQVRFSVGLRGYRMDEVDDVLDRLALDLEARDERIAVLEREAAAAATVPAVDGAAAEPDIEAAVPTEPAEPTEPAVPTEPAEPVEPVEPVGQTEPAAEQPEAADDEVQVGRTMIVPFQQTDRRFAAPADAEAPADDGPPEQAGG